MYLVKNDISVIIPVYNESARIKSFTENILCHNRYYRELIIVDGNSPDQTYADIAKIKHHQLLTKRLDNHSRARQMNYGASIAQGDWLLFLHADTTINQKAFVELHQTIAKSNIVGGAFSFGLDSNKSWAKFIEFTVHVRNTLFKLPYGDQGIFIRRDIFLQKLKGYHNMALMEDLDLVWRLRKMGRLVILNNKVFTSSRKWINQGYWPVTFKNTYYLLAFLLGRYT